MSCDVTFLHVGLTVADFDRTAEFYEKYFGFKKTLDSRVNADFFTRYKDLYALPDGAEARFGFLEAGNGFVLEIFQFSPARDFAPAVWNTPGYHHICLHTDDILGLCARMKADGVEFFFAPEPRGSADSGKYWVFLKDPDGNMIELQQ